MPPDGYETVTLPNDLVEQIDNIVGYNSRATAIQALLDSADMPHEQEWPDSIDDIESIKSSIETVEERTDRIEQMLEQVRYR